MWLAIGNLGDAVLMLSLAAVCFGWLTRSLYGWRIALSWIMLLAAGMLLVGLTKILHAGCGVQVRPLGFRAISGSAMLAATVLPMACLLMLHDGWRVRPGRALLPGLALAATIGVARASAHAHSASEVVAGWLLGALVTALLLKRWTDAPILPPRLRPFAIVSVLAVCGIAYGYHAPIQATIERYSPRFCTYRFCTGVQTGSHAASAARSPSTIGGTDQHSVGLARRVFPTMRL